MSNIPSFLYGQTFVTPPVPTASFSGKTVVITGANQGLGYDCAVHLLRLGVSHLILGCRDVAKGEAAKKRLGQTKGSKVEVWQVDLSSYDSVLAFAERCQKNLHRIDVFHANAGLLLDKYSTAEDNETSITVNIVSTFLMEILLLPKLRESATNFSITPYLCVVGSMIHLFADPKQLTEPPKGKIFDTINNPQSARMDNRYFLSKLIVMLCVRELAARADVASGSKKDKRPLVIINCPNPGWCATQLHRDAPLKGFGALFFRLIDRSCEEGSRTLVHAGVAGKESQGQYLSECQVKPPTGFVRSSESMTVQQNVWEELISKLEKIEPGISTSL